MGINQQSADESNDTPENAETATDSEALPDKVEPKAIPLGPATQAIIIQGIN